MPSLPEYRVRTRIPQSEMDQKEGRVLGADDFNVQLTGPSRVFAPDGRPLAVYLPGVLTEQMVEAYKVLTTIRASSENRGKASGTEVRHKQNNLMRAKPVMSSILGSFESSGFYKFCRLTSWTAQEAKDRWPMLQPLFAAVAGHFEEQVPDRFAAQMKRVHATQPEWIVEGTPFTTITVNNTFPTGVHEDAGDLDEGFSCLAVARRGEFTGGLLTFPEFRLAVDMQDGDLILMDAHSWHGNTRMVCACGTDLTNREQYSSGPCEACGAERISVVCYFRTNMVRCDSLPAEQQKQMDWAERVNAGPAPATAVT